MSLNITVCLRCSGPVTEAMRFCPSCGKRLTQRTKSFPLVLGASAVALFGVGFALQSYLIPPKNEPIAKQHSEQPTQVVPEDPQVAILREQLEGDPQNIEKLKMLAGILGDKLRNNPQSSNTKVFEAIDVLSRILAMQPNDPAALVMMADVSFDQKAFTKAQEFYERYLKLEPDNHGARARYASTLTFLGQYDKSISELNSVLKQDPKNFPAMAYLSITYAQQGDFSKAKETGSAALNIAPSDEARARFSAFMTTLDAQPGTGSSPARGNVEPAKDAQVPPQAATGISGFVDRVKSNPVAGPKFVGHEEVKDDLRLTFKDFPMSQMPPFAKDKFFGSLKKAAQETGISQVRTISFIDLASGKVMDQISLAK
jgi:cytochrome c-type biogenesis protein CcmH/NrfG